jgi:hypothetical protein
MRAKPGGKGIRTPDFQLAKLALYQLSYAPLMRLRIVDCGLGIATRRIGKDHPPNTRNDAKEIDFSVLGVFGG